MHYTHCTWFRAPENRSEVPHKPQRPRWHHASTLHLPCARRLPGRNATNILLCNGMIVNCCSVMDLKAGWVCWVNLGESTDGSSWFCRSDHQRTARSILMSRQVPGWGLFFPPLVEGKSAGNLQEIHGNPRMGMQKWDPTKWPVWQASFIGNMMIFHWNVPEIHPSTLRDPIRAEAVQSSVKVQDPAWS